LFVGQALRIDEEATPSTAESALNVVFGRVKAAADKPSPILPETFAHLA
jgi:hypothetical protein